jgi:hypothetical protein
MKIPLHEFSEQQEEQLLPLLEGDQWIQSDQSKQIKLLPCDLYKQQQYLHPTRQLLHQNSV